MRFDRLSLLRYGAHTDREIAFKPGARLHVVYGPNEAGKSSALAAISDLLFGFPHNKAFDFRHEATTLRIGATLTARDGTQLSFRRRRGNKATLLADSDDESELRDDALAPFVGSLGRDVFERAFGLDSARLRAGADAMLKSDGELGSLLFSAASGMTGLSGLKGSLEDEAGAIFAPRRSKDRRFYQLLDRYEAARKDERDHELRASDWKALNVAIAELEGRYETLAGERTEARRAAARLQRLGQLRPIVQEIDGDETALAAFADLDALPPGHADALADALASVDAASSAVERAEDQLRRQHAALARVSVDEPLLAREAEIRELFAASGDYTSKLKDLPRIEAERDDYDGELRQFAARLGMSDADLDASQPTDAALADLRTQVADGRRLATAAQNLDEQIEAMRAELDEARARRLGGPASDPRPWRDRFAALAPDIAALARRDEAEAARRARMRELQERFARLSPPVADLDTLATTPLPAPEAVRENQDALAANDELLRDVTRQVEETGSALERIEREIAEAETAGPVPSRTGIAEAREVRDTAFTPLADMVEGRAPPPAAQDAAAQVAQFRAIVRRADEAADAALDDATRLHAQETRLRTRQELCAKRRDLAQKCADLRGEREAMEARYRARFAPLDVEPDAPQRMLDWLRTVEDLLTLRREVLALDDTLATLDAAADRLRPALQALAAETGLTGAEALPVPALARAIEARLSELAEAWADRRTQAAQLEDRERRLETATVRRSALAAQEAEWATGFRAAAAAIGLGDAASLERADATVSLWDRIPDVRRERANRARRVDGMRRDIAAFEARVTELTRTVAPDLAGLPAGHAVMTLSERAQEARTADAQRASARAALKEAEAERARAQQAHAAALAERDRLMEAAPDGISPRDLLARLRARDERTESLDKCRRRFSEVAAGADEQAIRTDLAAFDPERAETEIDTLEREIERLDGEMNQVFAALSEKKRERERLDSAAGAERAAFERNAAEAEIVEAAREWAVLKLASQLLSAAMEKHRESEDDPLMRRAGALFATLTAGGFATIGREFGKDDVPELVGVRANGERVGIAALSDGTRDQLYLALRLAYLEDYATRHEPAPFIGDDLFQTFDDDRTAAGLAALAEASAFFQPILFTHEGSVVEIARATLGEAADIIRLDEPAPA
ncbi:ATP-binding protein [Amorphus coralli]|uniref:ATP-binding protein n=1 Tax=Amorphus coralli TaxID=340680 RepID=UPI00037F80A6|nr:YhaN family protein [Amorphus coralli]